MYFNILFPSDEAYCASRVLGLVACEGESIDALEDKAYEILNRMLEEDFGDVDEYTLNYLMYDKIRSMWKFSSTRTRKYGTAFYAKTPPPDNVPKWLFVEQIGA